MELNFTICPEKNMRICTLTEAFVTEQLKTFSAVTLEAADGVPAVVLAATIVKLALINICGKHVTSWQPFNAVYCTNALSGMAVPWHLCGCCLQSDLCMFFRPAAVWSQRGSCSARLWMCLYRWSRTPHCSPHRFLKGQRTKWEWPSFWWEKQHYSSMSDTKSLLKHPLNKHSWCHTIKMLLLPETFIRCRKQLWALR